jgi:hypothetical protein
LQRRRHVADLVEEQRAVVRRLEQAGLAAAPGARERPFLVAKQLGFEQRLGKAAQLTATKGKARRGLASCIPCASTSLPVPLSPLTSTVESTIA